jgi:mRNA interferase HigB
MHIIARPILRDFSDKHADACAWLDAWWKNVSKARWENPNEVKAAYDSVDRVGECYVFNVCGNRYRLIAKIVFAYQRNDGTIFVKHVLTHADYDKNAWKKDCES